MPIDVKIEPDIQLFRVVNNFPDFVTATTVSFKKIDNKLYFIIGNKEFSNILYLKITEN